MKFRKIKLYKDVDGQWWVRHSNGWVQDLGGWVGDNLAFPLLVVLMLIWAWLTR